MYQVSPFQVHSYSFLKKPLKELQKKETQPCYWWLKSHQPIESGTKKYCYCWQTLFPLHVYHIYVQFLFIADVGLCSKKLKYRNVCSVVTSRKAGQHVLLVQGGARAGDV